MKQRQLPELLERTRRDAVHWLRLVEINQPPYRKVTTDEVACGHLLDEQGFRNRTTKDKTKVTCRDCYSLAYQRPTP